MIEAKRINEKRMQVRIEGTGADVLMEFTQIVRSVCKKFPDFMVDKYIHMGKCMAGLNTITGERDEDNLKGKIKELDEILAKIKKELEKEN